MADHEVETKAGHPPALKVGGMRVAQHSRPAGSESGTNDPENPQIPSQDKEGGDSQIHGVGGLQSQPKDLLIKGTSGVPVTAKDLGLHEEEIRHTHDKGLGTAEKHQASHYNYKTTQETRHVGEPRNHGSNH